MLEIVGGCRGASSSNPLIHFLALELPKATHLVAGHATVVDPGVHGVLADTEVLADAILLVDNAAQPMQAAPCAVLRSLASSGYESKLVLCFTHFDEVTGDNLPTQAAKKGHVLSSVDNAIHAIGKALGRDAQHAIQRLLPDRAVFFASIQKRLSVGARFTLGEFERLLSLIADSITERGPVTYQPVYDLATLALSVQSATQEFHDVWRGRLGMGGRGNTPREHWTRVKALTRRVGVLNEEEYDTLMPVADLIRVLQDSISRYLSEPLQWLPTPPPDDAADARVSALAAIKTRVNKRLHELAKQRLVTDQGEGWRDAYEYRGPGSARDRARDLTTLYESAAPIPNEMPLPDVSAFLQKVRVIVAQSIVEAGGEVPGWVLPESKVFVEPVGDKA